MDLVRERYNSIAGSVNDYYEIERLLDNDYSNDPDIFEFRNFFVSDFIDFLTMGFEYYREEDRLVNKAVELLERQNDILRDSFTSAFIAFQKGQKDVVLNQLSELLKPISDEPLNEDNFAYLVVGPFKNAFVGFYNSLYNILSKYDVEEIVLEECRVLDEFYELVQDKKTKPAIELLLTIEGKYPDNIIANTLLGFEYYHSSMWGNSIAYNERILDKPASIFWIDEIYFSLGWACGKIKDHKKSIEYYEKSLEIFPTQMNALNNLGYEYYLTKQYKKAAKIFEQCLEEKRDEEYASNNYVKTLIAMKRFADAKAFIDTGKYKISSSLKKKIENKNNKDKPVLEDEPAISEVNERSKSSSAKAVEFSSEEILEDEIVNRLEKGMKTFGRKLKMYRRKGKYGRQYTIPYGRIDVLAEDDEGNVYIIELKKNSGYDDAYDEHILKYFEWFDKHPITDKKTYGIICLNNPSKELIEKVRRDERVELYNYKVMFDKVE